MSEPTTVYMMRGPDGRLVEVDRAAWREALAEGRPVFVADVHEAAHKLGVDVSGWPSVGAIGADLNAAFSVSEKPPGEALSEALGSDPAGYVLGSVRAVGEAIEAARRCGEPGCPLFGRLVDPKVHVHGDHPLPGVEETFRKESDD